MTLGSVCAAKHSRKVLSKKRQFAVCDLIYMIEIGFQSHTDAKIVLSANCHV